MPALRVRDHFGIGQSRRISARIASKVSSRPGSPIVGGLVGTID